VFPGGGDFSRHWEKNGPNITRKNERGNYGHKGGQNKDLEREPHYKSFHEKRRPEFRSDREKKKLGTARNKFFLYGLKRGEDEGKTE